MQNVSNTDKSIQIGIEEKPTRLYLNPSTPYVRGLRYAIIFNQYGSPSNGNSADDRKNSGKIITFMTSWNP